MGISSAWPIRARLKLNLKCISSHSLTSSTVGYPISKAINKIAVKGCITNNKHPNADKLTHSNEPAKSRMLCTTITPGKSNKIIAPLFHLAYILHATLNHHWRSQQRRHRRQIAQSPGGVTRKRGFRIYKRWRDKHIIPTHTFTHPKIHKKQLLKATYKKITYNRHVSNAT